MNIRAKILEVVRVSMCYFLLFDLFIDYIFGSTVTKFMLSGNLFDKNVASDAKKVKI